MNPAIFILSLISAQMMPIWPKHREVGNEGVIYSWKHIEDFFGSSLDYIHGRAAHDWRLWSVLRLRN